MKPRQIIRTGIAASAVAHLSVLTLMIFFSRGASVQFGHGRADHGGNGFARGGPPSRRRKSRLRRRNPSPPTTSILLRHPAAAAQPPPRPPPETASAATTAGAAASAAAQRPSGQSSQPPQPTSAALPPTPSPTPAYTPPEPDLSIKYHVMLGLPPELPPSRRKANPMTTSTPRRHRSADIVSSLITEFRRHLRTCSKLPASIAPSDKSRSSCGCS